MATVLPTVRTDSPPEAVIEALNGLLVGIVSVDYVGRVLAAAVADDERVVTALQSLVDDAYCAGTLAAEDYEALSRDLGHDLGEDSPTAWSEELVNEAGPAGDTARPGTDSANAAGLPAGAVPTAALRPGAVLRDRFVLQSQLPPSGMSEVFKALDRRRQEAGAEDPWVAIKIVSPSTKQFPDALRLLQQEATLAQRLAHPNIVQVFDFDRDGNCAFITMEWLDGESLAELLTRQRYRPLTSALGRHVLTQIGAALAFAHSRDVVHADVKPGNILITRDGTAKLLDFGIARSVPGPASGEATDARTPAYASCEVLEGDPATPQDDVYSLACVAYRMLAGRRAFGHNDALTAERTGRKPARIQALSGMQWAALEHALAFRRTARTPDMPTFLREFDGTTAPAADGPAAPAPDVPPAASPLMVHQDAPATRKPRKAWIGIAAGLAALALAVTLWPGDGDEQVADSAAPGDPPPAVTVTVPGTDAVTAAMALPANETGTPPRQPSPAARPRSGTPTAIAVTATPAKRRDTGKPRPARTPATAAPAAAPAEVSVPFPAQEPAPTPVVAVNASLLATASAPENTAVRDLAMSPAATSATPSDGGVARAGPIEPGPAQVLLTNLKFRRYVEPAVRNRSRGPDPAGWVQISFIVGADGRTRDISVVDSSPPGRYEEAALGAVKRWRFEPVREGGTAVERRTGVRLRFQPE